MPKEYNLRKQTFNKELNKEYYDELWKKNIASLLHSLAAH